MEFYKTISERRSIRNYSNRPVPEDSLKRIAEAVTLAPTACNRQPFKILAVRNAELRAAICAACPRRFLPEAPVILVALGDMVFRRQLSERESGWHCESRPPSGTLELA